MLNRLVRAQVIKGATTREKGKLDLPDPDRECVADGPQRPGTGGNGQPGERDAQGLSGICISPRRSLTIPADEEVVKTLGLKKGIKLTALDLSGL